MTPIEERDPGAAYEKAAERIRLTLTDLWLAAVNLADRPDADEQHARILAIRDELAGIARGLEARDREITRRRTTEPRP